jgi:sensor histidine kinase YesM
MRIFKRLSLNSFQFRLLQLVILTSVIPFLCAVLLFYKQSNTVIDKEFARYGVTFHQQLINQLQQKLEQLDQVGKNLSDDYGLKLYLSKPLKGESIDKNTINNYVNALINQRLQQNSILSDMCIQSLDWQRLFCSQPTFSVPDDNPNAAIHASFYKIIQVNNLEDKQKKTVIYESFPIYDANSDRALGQISYYINLNTILVQLSKNLNADGSLIVQKHSIFNSQNELIYDANYNSDPKLSEGKVLEAFFYYHEEKWLSRWVITHEAQTSSYNFLRTLLLTFFILLGLALVFSSYLFSRQITKPLNQLRLLMRRTELGDLRAYWTTRGIQEMNDLGESYNQMLNRVEDLIKQVKNEQFLKKEAKIEAMLYQINPHFLYNTLNTIKWVAKIHHTPQISEAVSALVRLLQASLGKKGDFMTIAEEIDLIYDYMKIQEFRYDDRIKLKIEIEAEAKRCLVPRMIFQPLVENAILHGIGPLKREGLITIKVWTDRDLLFCEVIDNGVGMPLESTLTADAERSGEPKLRRERMSGIGLSHIREKIKLYYGSDYKVHVSSEPHKGTSIQITMPILLDEE